MAEQGGESGGNRRQPSRLQRRAPASIQISPASKWNVAIPLLSPLVQSPTSPKSNGTAPETRSSCGKAESRSESRTEAEKPAVFKTWQHPAAPFCYGSAPLIPFVCKGERNR